MTTPFKPPRHNLFIASIGNPRPYRTTRHSAGHILLEALLPLLPVRIPQSTLYKTWQSPSYMNESGHKLLRQLKTWLASSSVPHNHHLTPTTLTPTLVILHDELEAPLGKIRVKRGGPESASLRGHRGLISIIESLNGKGYHYSSATTTATTTQQQKQKLSILRVGVGIGRPQTRSRGDVAEYVLTEMTAAELAAVRAAAGSVVDILADEIYREDGRG